MPSCKNLTSTKKGGKSRKIGGKKKRVTCKKSAKKAKDSACCFKCGKTTKMKNGGTVITLKNGRKALTGQCVKCGTKMFKFIAS
tara:strand:+ start:159 stop:410 length:252 start_codon:yes stop_codon:yes gene_type:complete